MPSSPSARRYSGNRCFFLLLRVLRCFSSPGSPRTAMDSPCGGGVLPRRVSPFRNLRVSGYLPLAAAYRSLSRLSSALSAKASALCPYQLDHSCGPLLPPRAGASFRGAPSVAPPASCLPPATDGQAAWMSMPAASPAGTGRGRLCIFFFPYAVFNVPAASVEANGDGEIRTHDPLLARQVLSQLSYTPNFNSYSFF